MLAQEHLDWHGSVEAYRRDKLNLLHHARHCIVNVEARASAGDLRYVTFFDPRPHLQVANRYLARSHNLSNLSAALAVAQQVGVDRTQALRAAEDFSPLAHRQQEIGEIDGVLYVDDSISTTPESAIAALDVYRGRPVSIIIGGQDRGIDYGALVERLSAAPPLAIILLGASGRRICDLLASNATIHLAQSMREAVDLAREATPPGGVILLSPAAPSYGMYRNFIERGEDFSRCAGV
jgi:UDP-N-acetylmuramoylalanine--D-glutamate ligase